MQKHNFYFTLILLCLTCSIWGQAKKTYSNPYPEFRGGATKTYFQEGDFAYAIKANNDEIAIQKFAPKNTAFIKESRIKIRIPRKGDVFQVLKFHKKCYVFYTSWNRKEKTDNLFIFEVNYETLTINPNPRKIIAVKGAIFNAFDTPKFNLVLSENKSKLLIHYTLLSKLKNDSNLHIISGFYVFDDNFELITNREFSMPYINAKMEIKDWLVSNQGVPCILISKDENQQGELLTFNLESSGIEKTELDEIKHWGNTFKLHEKTTGDILIIGFRPKVDTSIFIYNVNQSKYNLYQIPNTVTNHYSNTRNFTYPIEVLEVHNQKDGSFIILANKRPKTTKGSIYQSIGGYTYYFYDFILTRINSNSELEWMSLLPRRFAGGVYSPRPIFNYDYADGKHYIVYVASKENERLALDVRPTTYSYLPGQSVCVYEVDDKEGTVERHKLMGAMLHIGIPIWYLPSCDVIYVGENSFITDFHRGDNEDLLIKMKIQK